MPLPSRPHWSLGVSIVAIAIAVGVRMACNRVLDHYHAPLFNETLAPTEAAGIRWTARTTINTAIFPLILACLLGTLCTFKQWRLQNARDRKVRPRGRTATGGSELAVMDAILWFSIGGKVIAIAAAILMRALSGMAMCDYNLPVFGSGRTPGVIAPLEAGALLTTVQRLVDAAIAPLIVACVVSSVVDLQITRMRRGGKQERESAFMSRGSGARW